MTVGSAAATSVRTTASHTIGVPHLTELLRAVPPDAGPEQYRFEAIENNVLGRATYAGRKSTFRHLKALYRLDPGQREFAALRQLWDIDPTARPLLAGILAVSRDEILRASFSAIQYTAPDSAVTSADLAAAIVDTHGRITMSDNTLAKAGRNTAACWTQTGHLVGRSPKVRRKVVAPPAAVAYAAYLGYLSGRRGLGVLETPWAAILDLSSTPQLDALHAAHAHRFLDLRAYGGVVEVDFPLFSGGRS